MGAGLTRPPWSRYRPYETHFRSVSDLKRWTYIALALLVLMLAMGASAQPIADLTASEQRALQEKLPVRAPSFWTGHDWVKLSPSEQALFLAGMKGMSTEFGVALAQLSGHQVSDALIENMADGYDPAVIISAIRRINTFYSENDRATRLMDVINVCCAEVL